ncbi:reverse transcriptase domain-containing protein [Oceanobacillus sp. AG]|uniref:reverse transcriptase domain-containing protein n=1 Tax=Oceanobacillus sp. AG TaxID=2681969 RepID=UPI00210309DA|nr:reverse transcriptase domain-containing protein [Oceanobacillus sp. AG]
MRYADDFVILCRTKPQALESIRVIQAIMGKFDLSLHKEKSRLVNIWDDSDGFDFLEHAYLQDTVKEVKFLLVKLAN